MNSSIFKQIYHESNEDLNWVKLNKLIAKEYFSQRVHLMNIYIKKDPGAGDNSVGSICMSCECTIESLDGGKVLKYVSRTGDEIMRQTIDDESVVNITKTRNDMGYDNVHILSKEKCGLYIDVNFFYEEEQPELF